MKNRYTLLWVSLLLIFLVTNGMAQTVTELVVPKYFGSKTAASTNNARTAFAICFKIDGLTPNTSYDLKPGLGLISDAATSYGAGNYWNQTTFSGTTNLLNYFTTDATGSSGPVWIFMQPTGNASRFDAGQQHKLRLGWCVAGGSMPTSPLFVGSKIMTALDIAATARTTATADDGCFVKGSSLTPSNGKYVLLFDNETGTGDPLFSYMIRQMIPTQVSNSELPTPVNDVYMQAGTSALGDYTAIVPIGANNPNGIRRVESRNADNTVYAFNTSSNGIWPSGANTTTALRRDVIVLTNTDTPLTPSGPTGPSVTTSPAITNISFNSATGGGDVTSAGGGTITARGLCWGTSASPTIAGAHSTEPGSLGTFTSNMTGLSPNTTYHVRAYATNSVATTYGGDVTFSTLCEVMPPAPNFSASKVNLVVGESINFFDSTQYCPDTWSWSFVGGVPGTSAVKNPTGIQYNYAGDFTVCLTATNQWGTATACKNNYIHVVGPTNAPIVMTEINYRSPITGTDSLEFIELYNNGSAPVDMTGFHFSKGVEFTFPSFTLNSQAYVLVAKSSAWITNYYHVSSYQWNSGSALTNQGEAIVLKDVNGYVVDSVYYMPTLPWDTLANGKGPSLELCDPNANNSLAENWRHAVEYQGKLSTGDSLWASPLAGCSYLPVAGFTVSDSTITLGQSVVFTDASTGALTWFWEFERGIPETFNGQNPPPVLYNIMGSYDVTLTVTNGTGQSKKYKPMFIQVGPSGIHEKTVNDGFTVHPNPVADGKFILTFVQNSSYEVTLVSGTGKIVAAYQAGGRSLEINQPGLSKGLYLIQARDKQSGNIYSQKLIIQ